jgi:glycosyltransferase involved in cell wall biosynthesis
MRSSTWLSWNANNTFSFNRVPWAALKAAANITTVSRYMKQEMVEYGVDAYVTPNGISDYWLRPIDHESKAMFQALFPGRLVLTKVARWDPDKRWHQAIDAVADLKRSGLRPLLLARGGSEPHGVEVLGRAAVQGLSVGQAVDYSESVPSFIDALAETCQTDAIILREPLGTDQRRLLFHTSDAVLANSGVEPFGLVGLETMASGGVAIVGATGEDYATPGYDCLAAQRGGAKDLAGQLRRLVEDSKIAQDIRKAARTSAEQYTWAAVIKRCLLPAVAQDFGEAPDSRRSNDR